MSERRYYYQPDGLIASWTEVSNSFDYVDCTKEELADHKGCGMVIMNDLLIDAQDADAFIRAVKMVRAEHGARSEDYAFVKHWDDEVVRDLGHAVEILNKYQHGGCNKWIVAQPPNQDIVFTSEDDESTWDYDVCTSFTAIAIAEKYLRDANA